MITSVDKQSIFNLYFKINVRVKVRKRAHFKDLCSTVENIM